MKKFCNKIAVRGSKPLLKAFAEELKEMGYKLVGEDIDSYTDAFGNVGNPKYITTNGKHYKCKIGEFTFAMNEGVGYDEYTLIEDWDKAIQLASEVEEEVPEYVKCIETTNENPSNVSTERIYKVVSYEKNKTIIIVNNEGNNWNCYNIDVDNPSPGNVTNFVRSTKTEFDAQELEFKEKELLKEARKRFPVGSKFYPAHLNGNKNYCIVTNNNFTIYDSSTHSKIIYALTDEGDQYNGNSKYGNNTTYARIVYANGQWATIIEDKFKNGDYVVILNNNNGANLPINSVQIIRNFQYIHTNKTWIEIESSISSRYYKGDGDIRKATPEEVTKYNQSKKEDSITIAGYEAEIKNNTIAFGCKRFSKEDLEAIKRVVQISDETGLIFNFKDDYKVHLDYDDNTYEISIDKINTLIDKLEELDSEKIVF